MARIKLTNDKLAFIDTFNANTRKLEFTITSPGSKYCGPPVLAASTQTAICQVPEQKVSPHHFFKTIVVDAGHGGDDPGAIGQNGTKEKDLNLALAQELFRLLREDGYEVFMTRHDDTFIPLGGRTQFANDKQADIFISIHNNAMPDNLSTEGFEIYFLSEKASDRDAASTMALENAVVSYEKNMKVSKKDREIRDLLMSMVVNEFINDSSELCSFISGQVNKRIKISNRGIKQANFAVLRGSQMPAILVECAYLSNIKEEARLKTKKFKEQMCDAILAGLKEYEHRKELLAISNESTNE